MFGLMLKNACGVHENEREHYRLHYCGTCKAIGKQYSQSARMFLNFDCVFLAELLTALSAEDTGAWQDSYHSYNCLATGGEGVELPFPLRYASTTNVLFSALKTDDNLKDASSLLWRLVQRWFNTDFNKAEQEMRGFGVDMDEIWYWIACQQQREKEKITSITGEAALRYFAEPTARITAAIFSKGVELTGRTGAVFGHFGYQLGELIYVLDALEDEERDRKKKNFNALQSAFQLVDEAVRKSVGNYLLALSLEMQDTIRQLPIPEDRQDEFRQRLSANVAVRVANALEAKKPVLENIRRTFQARIAARLELAASFAQRVTQHKPSWIAAPQYAFTWMAMILAPRLPHELNSTTDHTMYAVPAFTAVMTGFLTGLVFRRRIRRFLSLSKKEWRRARRNMRKGPKDPKDPKDKKPKTWLIILIVLAFICLMIFLCKSCCSSTEKKTQQASFDCDACCSNCTSDCCESFCQDCNVDGSGNC